MFLEAHGDESGEGGRKPRLLFFYLHPSSFVLDDIRILQERTDVRLFHYRGGQRGSPATRFLALLLEALRQIGWLIRHLPRSDLVAGWFADYHLALPVLAARLARKPSLVVLGGFDGNHLPELRYGSLHSRWRAPLTRFVVRRATRLLAVTPGLVYGESRFATWPDLRSNGILAHVPGLKTPREVLPTGFETAFWEAGPETRPATVCTVAAVASHRTALIKGLDLFIEVARRLPDVPFLVLGLAPEALPMIRERYHLPANTELRGPVPREDLRAVYQAHSVYLQLSRTEGGLPMVLGEAMLCGCLPVVSAAGGMPDTVGDTGPILESPDPAGIAMAVAETLAVGADPIRGPAARARARERIVARFSIERRRRRLLEIISEMTRPPYEPASASATAPTSGRS